VPAKALAPVDAAFRAIATTFVPELAAAGPAEWSALGRTIDSALESRPAALTGQLVAFIRALDLVSRLRYWRSLPALPPDRRLRLLRSFERSPVLAFRRGVWGLRTLVFMGYYTQPSVIESLGYQATPAGWSR